MQYEATSDYEVIDRNPLAIKAGDTVKVGRRDEGWDGWVWVSTEDGRGSYVPEELLAQADAAMGSDVSITGEFTAKDLSIIKGEVVDCLKEVKGWLWCRNGSGVEGWLPAYLMRAL